MAFRWRAYSGPLLHANWGSPFVFQPTPTLTGVSAGYDGFAINHVMDAGKKHEIRIAKCTYLDLETALLDTAPKHMDPTKLSQSTISIIQDAIDTCRLNAAKGSYSLFINYYHMTSRPGVI